MRAAHRYLAMQSELVDAHLAATTLTESGPKAAIVAAAQTPAAFAERFPASAKLLHVISRDELLGDELPDAVAAELARTDRVLVELMVGLARALWGRGDARAVDVITICLVDLPTAILLRRNRIADPLAREHLRAAVCAVLDVGPRPKG